MRFNSWLYDKKVRGVNVSVDIAIGDYWELARHVIEENDLQRRRVSARGKPYQLLMRDLLDGCVMPPIILALKQEAGEQLQGTLRDVEEREHVSERSEQSLREGIEEAFCTRDVLILDGLQRTYTIGDALSELDEDHDRLDHFKHRTIRVEVYVGLSKTGILYRMLTLNTGQTPMSFRHQIEMLYHDHIDNRDLPDGIEVVREADERRARGAARYKFSDVVDMFYAYTTGRAESIDRQTLVNRLGEMKFLEEYKEGDNDLQELLVLYNRFVRKVEREAQEWEFDLEELRIDVPDAVVERPFARNVCSLLERVQPMTAFGAEVRRLMRREQIRSFDEMSDVVNQCGFSSHPFSALNHFILALDHVAKSASKIGSAQREMFQFAFRALLNSESDSYCDFSSCWREGQQKYESLN